MTSNNTKSTLHPNNKHRLPYDFEKLTLSLPELSSYIIKNKKGQSSIDFFNAEAVIALNKALLKRHYGIKHWTIPEGYLCPPIPGRADYIHYVADLLDSKNDANVLDIGTGANCIYPLIGQHEYNWKFTCSEIDPIAIENAREIILKNKLEKTINIKHQSNPKEIFFGIIQKSDYFNITICNPPFFKSLEEAIKSNKRKVKNLLKTSSGKSIRNFGGQNNELWYKGGEKSFIKKMIKESLHYKDNVGWFTVLVSNQNNLKAFEQAFHNIDCTNSKVLEMKQGQKTSRILAWRF